MDRASWRTRPAAVMWNHADGTMGRVRSRVERAGGLQPIDPDAPVVGQVSRWDRLKDPVGFVRMFADQLAADADLHAIFAGPRSEGVDDDPHAAEVCESS